GTGLSASQHLTALKNVASGRPVAIASSSVERARAVARDWGIPRAYGSLAELVGDAEVEAVHACTPPGRRLEVARAAAAAGRTALPEKPMARTVAEADEIVATCDRAGVRLACMFQNRFTPLARTVRAAVDEGRLGRLLLVTLTAKWYRTAAYYQETGWR